MNPMKTCIIAIAKLENHYIREWVEYYDRLGIDKIFLYDNNDLDGERFEEVIDDYIKSGFVDVVDFRGKISRDDFNLQSYSYQDCYTKHENEYDWFLIVDCDEFLYLNKYNSIEQFLNNKKFDDYDGIRFQWKMMNDNNHVRVENNDYSLRSRFTNGKLSRIGKSIIRGGLEVEPSEFHGHAFKNKSYCDIYGKPCLPLKDSTRPAPVHDKPSLDDDIYIEHYITKTIQEWIDIKLKRLYPDQTKEKASKTLSIETFFTWNEKTPQKINYIKSRGFEI